MSKNSQAESFLEPLSMVVSPTDTLGSSMMIKDIYNQVKNGKIVILKIDNQLVEISEDPDSKKLMINPVK